MHLAETTFSTCTSQNFSHLESQIRGKLPLQHEQPTSKHEIHPSTSEKALVTHRGITTDVTTTGIIYLHGQQEPKNMQGVFNFYHHAP